MKHSAAEIMNDTRLSDYIDDIRNIVEDFIANQYHHKEASVIALIVLYPLLFVVGIIGNSLILYWIGIGKEAKQRKLVFYPFLVNLCISDIMVLITCCPFVLYSHITSIWHLGKHCCLIIHYLQDKIE
ncbi:orexin receptor type 2-like protein [Dinothrombium tinctorium]|uniref:Orexin receptor type 2-like protein n=1 Tax=Dinothrombium tinctorium TaxID=1965070 RepID=A0A3S3NMN6_9ACAR|nr:orexin receptor type 2-like protein [Dinothrombium tinctorium]